MVIEIQKELCNIAGEKMINSFIIHKVLQTSIFTPNVISLYPFVIKYLLLCNVCVMYANKSTSYLPHNVFIIRQKYNKI